MLESQRNRILSRNARSQQPILPQSISRSPRSHTVFYQGRDPETGRDLVERDGQIVPARVTGNAQPMIGMAMLILDTDSSDLPLVIGPSIQVQPRMLTTFPSQDFLLALLFVKSNPAQGNGFYNMTVESGAGTFTAWTAVYPTGQTLSHGPNNSSGGNSPLISNQFSISGSLRDPIVNSPSATTFLYSAKISFTVSSLNFEVSANSVSFSGDASVVPTSGANPQIQINTILISSGSNFQVDSVGSAGFFAQLTMTFSGSANIPVGGDFDVTFQLNFTIQNTVENPLLEVYQGGDVAPILLKSYPTSLPIPSFEAVAYAADRTGAENVQTGTNSGNVQVSAFDPPLASDGLSATIDASVQGFSLKAFLTVSGDNSISGGINIFGRAGIVFRYPAGSYIVRVEADPNAFDSNGDPAGAARAVYLEDDGRTAIEEVSTAAEGGGQGGFLPFGSDVVVNSQDGFSIVLFVATGFISGDFQPRFSSITATLDIFSVRVSRFYTASYISATRSQKFVFFGMGNEADYFTIAGSKVSSTNHTSDPISTNSLDWKKTLATFGTPTIDPNPCFQIYKNRAFSNIQNDRLRTIFLSQSIDGQSLSGRLLAGEEISSDVNFNEFPLSIDGATCQAGSSSASSIPRVRAILPPGETIPTTILGGVIYG